MPDTPATADHVQAVTNSQTATLLSSINWRQLAANIASILIGLGALGTWLKSELSNIPEKADSKSIIEAIGKMQPTVIVNPPGTPLRTPEEIKAAIDALGKKGNP